MSDGYVSPKMRSWLDGVERREAQRRRRYEEQQQARAEELDRLLRGEDEEQGEPHSSAVDAFEARVDHLTEKRGMSMDAAVQLAETEFKDRAQKRGALRLEEGRRELERLLTEGE